MPLIYNVDFLVSSQIFLIIILYHFIKNRALDLENNRMFFWLVLVGMANIIFDVISAVLISRADPRLTELSWVCLTIRYSLQILVPHTLLYYVRSYLPSTPAHRRFKISMNVTLAVLVLMIFWNRWCGIFFGISETGEYYQGPLYFVMFVITGGYLLSVGMTSVIHRKALKKFRVRALWELLAAAFVTIGFQSVYPHTLLAGFGIALGITILFFTVNNPYYYTDSLTSTFDIRYFRERSRNFIEHHRNFHVLSVELSQIKRINLLMGADIGSGLLTDTAAVLKGISKRNMVFRISGKRFLIMSPTVQDYEHLCRRTIDYFSSPIAVRGEQINVPAKICAIRNAHMMGSSNAILAYVDYLSGKNGSNTETSFIQSTDQTLHGFHYNQEVERYLDIALQHDLFEVVYQPVYALSQNRYVSVEVLSRLHHPGLGMIPPDVFITIAEKNDQIAKIGLLQMRRVCRFVQEHPELRKAVQNVKVNLSPAELMKPGHAEELISIIREFDLPTEFFQFEITETVATEYNDSMGRVTTKFTDAGIGLCMDDFGSGYANLNTVLKLPFKVIKLDRSLLSGICQDSRTASLYESIVYSLRNMGFYIVSEGIETPQELAMVSGWGVDMIQGYYFARPMSGIEMLRKVQGEVPAHIR